MYKQWFKNNVEHTQRAHYISVDSSLVLFEKNFLYETKNHNPPCKLNGRSLILVNVKKKSLRYILRAIVMQQGSGSQRFTVKFIALTLSFSYDYKVYVYTHRYTFYARQALTYFHLVAVKI
jgi:hypothetical protein